MKEELLTRLVEALENINGNLLDINTSLENLEQNLQECTIYDGSRPSLCVTGNIANY